MFYKKQGSPEEDEIVICTVKKILPHGVFVSLDEYKDKEGLIHISEISPGRVRNIRDFVKEGKKIVCKILKINRERNHIDLSLRRVTQSQRINKNTAYKQEQKAEKILEVLANKLGISLEEVYKNIGNKLIEKYPSLYESYEEINADPNVLQTLDLDKKAEKILLELIQEKVKKKEIKISATITLSSPLPNGINIIKELLKKIQINGTKIIYLGAPRYKLTLTADDYKTAERHLSEIESIGLKMIKDKGIFKIERDDKRNT
ncbi:translation initiation factor IF-2 subunit alpha [Candidatus Woesearchaeota archaeon]|nr:translation initiation factor IF-2 subunit alpha [Candidatus Woesearchaeota archaeon]